MRDGVGPIVYRRYWVEIENTTMSAIELMDHIRQDINYFAPKMLGYFEETEDRGYAIQTGEEFFIDIAGPFNGPVRVADVGGN